MSAPSLLKPNDLLGVLSQRVIDGGAEEGTRGTNAAAVLALQGAMLARHAPALLREQLRAYDQTPELEVSVSVVKVGAGERFKITPVCAPL